MSASRVGLSPTGASRLAPSLLVAALLLLLALAGGPLAAAAVAAPEEWRLEQPEPPPPPAGVQDSEVCQGEPTNCHRTPVGLGRIGDIEFFKPNLGLLITAGNGSTVPPGVWVYNGAGWHELASVCGATDGRIAWAGPEEFWTVSDGRPGQAANGEGDLPPLEDDTLCHFAYNATSGRLEVVGSYAAPAFQASSYQPMHAAACLSPTDCWFAGAPLPEPEPGAFHLHWNGSSLEAEPNTAVQAVQDMRIFEGRLYESIGLPLEEPAGLAETPTEILHPSILQEIAPEGSIHAFAALHPRSSEGQFLPQYAYDSHTGLESFPPALGFLHLSADEDSLWAAAGPLETPPKGSAPAELTVLRDAGGVWTQVLGPEETGEAEKSESVKVDPSNLEKEAVSSLAAEPESASAWLALDTQADLKSPNATELAKVVNVTAEGSLSEEQVPSEKERAEGVGAKGAAYKIVCPARHDCWMATTQGWLFHLSEEGSRTLALDAEPAFNGELITFRPHDQGLPQELSDALISESPQEESPPPSSLLKVTATNNFATTTVPLLSDVHTRLVHGSTLELSFHLAVKARVRLIAKRHSNVVASTPTRTLEAGKRSLQLRLDRRRWPTKLALQTHALAPLPTVSSLSSGVETISTSLAFPKALGLSGWGPSL
jgi:hypothetical protein